MYDKEDLKARKLPVNTRTLQTLQNNMIRVIHGYKRSDKINMEKTRQRIRMMSVNQMAVYHTILEAFNVERKSSSEQIKAKWQQNRGGTYSLRRMKTNDLKVPEKPKLKCTGFSYNAARLFNSLPTSVKTIEKPNKFKSEVKDWIWHNIPSY